MIYQGGEVIEGAWYPVRKGRKGTQDEVGREEETKAWQSFKVDPGGGSIP